MEFAVQELCIAYGARVLFDALSFVVERGQRVAFAGHNGAGKSTLMKCIIGDIRPDAGHVVLPRHTRVGYLPQDGIHLSGVPLLQEVLDSVGDVAEMSRQLEALSADFQKMNPSDPSYRDTLEELGRLELILQDHDAHSLRPRAETILRGLGFGNEDFTRDCGEFSGGWQMRIALAKLLLREPDVLLLDEPTNHLDLQSQRWLEQYLRGYRGAICIISHDVALLDSLVSRTIALHHGRAEEYAGNFSYYLKESAARREARKKAAKSQQKQIEKTRAFINRFRYEASRAGQVQSRLKQLEKIELIEEESDEDIMSFHFPPAPAGGATVVELQYVSKAYGNIHLLKRFNFRMEKGDRIAIVGVNGAGKSTFSRLIAMTEEADSGTVKFGSHTHVAFFSQTHADVLDPSQTVLECVEQAASRETLPIVRNLLGCFLFHGDDVFKRIGVLSGGEKSRVALVCMLLHPANFLIMDEPTNHLDVESQEVLQRALAEYPGAFCIVSHNRSFLDPLVNKVLEFRPGHNPRLFYGNVTQYLEKIEADAANAADSSGKLSSSAPRPTEKNRQLLRRERALAREHAARVIKPLQTELKKVEEDIAARDARKAEITDLLDKPDVTSDANLLRSLTEEYRQLDSESESLFSRWAELSEQIDKHTRQTH